MFCYFRSHHSHLSLATSVGNRSNTSMWRERLDISFQWQFFRALPCFVLFGFFSCTLLFRPLVLICLTLHYLILYFNDNSRVSISSESGLQETSCFCEPWSFKVTIYFPLPHQMHSLQKKSGLFLVSSDSFPVPCVLYIWQDWGFIHLMTIIFLHHYFKSSLFEISLWPLV